MYSAMSQSETVLSEQLHTLKLRFAEQLEAKIQVLAGRWSALGGTLEDSDALHDLELLAHNLAGAGATFGYASVSETARALENIFSRALDPASSQEINPSARIGHLIERLIRAASTPSEPVAMGGKLARGKSETGRDQRLIFLVDDDREQASLLAEGIRHFGYEVRVFASPRGIETALARSRPDLVLMDIIFPEGPSYGLECVTAISDPQVWGIPLIFMSSRDDFEARLAAVRAGASDYFQKPADPIKLIERIDQLTAVNQPEPYRILVVEDDETLAEAYALALRGSGMTVEIVSEPREITRCLDEFDAELILMDLYLPRCSGLDLAKVIRQQEAYTSVPIVFLSTEGRLDRQMLAMSLGGDDFLTKPIRPDYLVASVFSRVQRARVLRSFMVKDSMTGALNHANILESLRSEVARASRSGGRFAFALIDIDLFKTVNDTYGHPTGDRVIKSLARLLQQRLRRTDVIGRYGGEEFALILPDTEATQAHEVVDALRGCFEAIRQSAGSQEFAVTFSAGVATYPQFENAGSITEAADKALYLAKNRGRNQVVLAG